MEHISIIAQLVKKSPEDSHGVIKIRGFYKRKPAGSRSLGYKVLEKHWDNPARAVLPGAPNAALINANIKMKVQQIEATLMKKQIMGATLNRNQVNRAVKGLDDSRDFLAFCRERIELDYKSKETKRTYHTEADKLEIFRRDVSFADLEYELFAKYKKYMEEDLGNDVNTVFKAFKFINTFINKAIKIGGIIDENPFKTGFDRGKYTQKDKIGLDMRQCDLIEPICTNEHHPVIVRRVAIRFLLMCYSGMRLADALRFDPNVHTKDGRFIMTYQKFQTNVNFEIYPRLDRMIELVRTNPLKISQKDFRTWLKVVGTLAGIEEDLNPHKGRHTLGGFLAELEIPIPQAAKIMGHKDPRSTKVYYHMKDKSIDRLVQKINTL